jgi:hypothetical protein
MALFFYGAVLDRQGEILVIPSHKIINPLCGGASIQSLQKIKQLKNARWDLAYLKPTGQIIVWPHLIASAKDQIDSPAVTEVTEWQQPRLLEKKSLLGHIFKKAKGHFEQDTPENRAYILEVVSSLKNKAGVDAFGKELYLKIMPDGTQAWAYVENGVITSGGCNRIPMQWIVDPKSDQGGKLVPLQSHAHPPDVADFVERIQSNQLSMFYNSFHPKKAIDLHPAEMQEVKEEVKGISHTAGTILNLLEELQTSEVSEHFFFIPDASFSLSEKETKQILLELARGIYIYDTIPFFSLHFNSQMQLYPVIHPIYKNTFVGYTISMLDYYMKGLCNGSFFEESFIQEWNKNPTTDKKLLKEKSIDFREYCRKHLGEASLTFHEMFLEVEKQSEKSSQGLIFAKKIDISYRIIGKQNSIKKAENLFTLDGDFDVLYTIGSKPSSKEQEPHFQNLEKTCQLMCKQIKEKLPRLPGMKKLFDAMNLMNFYVYYFNTLKAAEKIPTLNANFFPTELKACPSFFPPLPESEAAKISFKPASLFKHLPKEQIAIFISYLQQPNSKDLEEAALHILTAAIEKTLLRKTSNKDFTFDEYKELALALLPAFKGRYQATHLSSETTLMQMQIKTSPDENLSAKQISSRMNELFQGIQRDIEGVEKIIKDKRSKQLSHAKELQWLLDLQFNKEQVLKYTSILQQWFQDPLAIIFAEAVISLNLITKALTVQKEKSSGKIHIAGGCVIHVKDMVFQEASSSLLKKYGPILSSMSSDKMIAVEAGESEASGVLFKLPFENFHATEEDKTQSAIGYLYPSHPKYPMNDAIARVFHAINTQDEKIFVEVADQIQEWNFQDALGVSFIHYAASIPNPFFLQELIRRKVDLKVRDSQGLTALHYAAKKGNLACLKMLIGAAPALIDAQTDDGETPLYIATQNNQLFIVQVLIKEKIDVNLTTKHGMNSLICALHHGYEQIALELLHTQSIDVEYRLLNGKTALHFAIETKMEHALKELIKQGANVNRILGNGYRPIHLAVVYDWLNGVKILATTENIKLEAPIASGKTARDLANETNRREIMEFFDPSRSRGISWWTPWKLFYAKP